jgi:SAM-dependent methyltransferase
MRNRLRTSPAVVGLRNRLARWRYRGASHDEIFDDEYFQFVEWTSAASAEVMADSIVTLFAPRSAWDVGCGTGALLNALRSRGVVGQGLEYAKAGLLACQARGLNVQQFDLVTDTLDSPTPADVAISLEVGAQLPASAADRYVDLLCTLGQTGIVFSSETPGGGDRVSRNEQPHAYWIEKFAARGFVLLDAETRACRVHWREQSVADWFCRNLLLFKR